MRKRIISPRTLILAVAATALIATYFANQHGSVQAETYLNTSRFQLVPASDVGIETPGALMIFDSHQGILRQWEANTVITYEFEEFQKIPEKRVYRQR